ncbi:RcpC/CpaB family pilus assembly protein [Arthrobacter sp. FX8]|uniref:Flp pilus assembly protein CpaB n=1 Tax=Arthrobacter sp. FX8 TaxID=2997335 RepID=UPI00227AAABC|nr:RcpC/CpaB family pilus assembly protein [Arthrobacter sp. FX8]WAJ31733.1 RcpC/CpaB family pilus assembly protein [Arthrobacter sp. FX8]
MKTRLLGGIAALLVAVIGTVMLVMYVQNADKRALADTETESVYVVEKPVAAGTAADKLAASVAKKEVPKLALASDTVSSLSDLGDKVTAVPLVPGEQLLSSRLVDANSLLGPSRVQVPEGMQEITLKLPIERVVGGVLKAGDTVGLFISLDDATTNAATGDVVSKSSGTQLTFHKVLVTASQFSNGTAAKSDSTATASAGGSAPAKKDATGDGTYLITLARGSADAEKIVFAAEFGNIYLSREPGNAIEGTVGVVDKTRLFR